VVTRTGHHSGGGASSGSPTFDGHWVFLAYRLPREPSAPRLALWRAVHRLGAVQVGDGLVALPSSARTLEHAQWLAVTIEENQGSASVWLAQPMSARTHTEYAEAQRAAVDAEYRSVLAEAREVLVGASAGGERDAGVGPRRAVRRLRGLLRRIGSRDYFGAPTGDAARAAVDRLASSTKEVVA